MKLTTVILLTAILQVSASAFAQKVTLSEKNAPLNKVFEKISDQTGYDFLISTENLKRANLVTINAQNEELKAVLDKMFAGQPLDFVIQDRMVVVSKKQPEAVNQAKQAVEAPIKITGKVTDTAGTPLQGATIKIKSLSAQSVTNAAGEFTIENGTDKGVLTISFVGYQTVEMPFDLTNRNGLIFIQLHREVSSLNDVQIIGYGTTTKRLNAGSVSSIKSADIENQPVSNPVAALQGRASGVSIQTQNGLPGGNISVQIRGQGSIASGTDPLYIVDGVPFLSAGIASNQSANGVISPLNSINPGDIESIDILKDADATAIYGSRGANGVVLITTKKGGIGKTNFDVSVNSGLSEASRYNRLLSLSQYLQMRREAFENDGITPTASNAPDLLVWSQTQSTDWQKFEFGHKAPMTNIQTSLSGGDSTTRFLFSTNYRNEGTIFPGDENYKKGGGFLSLTHTSPNKKFNANLSVSYELDDNHTLYSELTTTAYLPPNYPTYNPDGSYYFDTGENPIPDLNQRTRIQSNTLIANGTLSYQIIKGLDIKANIGYTKYSIDQLVTIPATSQNNLYSVPLDLAYQTDNSSGSFIIEPQIDYNRSFGKGKFAALFGGTLQNRVDNGEVLTESGVNNPDLLGNIGAASTITATNSYTEYKYVSLFGRINYNWLQKYVIDLNFRRDGSSRFGNDKQFGNFGAVGAAWIFTEENFIRENVPFLSFGKLRGSYGITGNDQISDYQYLTAYNSGTIYGGTASLAPSRIANPDYSWETTRQFEAALEIGLLNNQIMLTTAWYMRRSDNQLVTSPLPYQSGFSGYQANLPALVQNTGWEIDLNTTNIKSKNFRWTTTFNFTLPKNVLLAFPNIANSTYANSLVVGQDLTVVRGYNFIGLNAQTGLPQFQDLNKDGIINTQDRIILGKTSPTLFGGFGNTVSFYSFQLDVFLEFRKQSSFSYSSSFGSGLYNEPVSILSRWQMPGDQTNTPRFTTDYTNLGNYATSSAAFTDASYLRVKNASLSYKFPSAVIKKLDLKALSLFLEGENILTFANRNRLDPEISGSSGSIPPLRSFVVGLKITF